MRSVLASVLLLLLSIGASGADRLTLPNVTFPVKISGVDVAVVASGDVDLRTTANDVALTANVTIDLADLQAKMPLLVQSLSLPKDNCAKDPGQNVVVNSISGATLVPAGAAAHLHLDGKVTAWTCGSVLGVHYKTEIPGATDVNLSVDADVSLDIGDGKSTGLKTDKVQVSADGVAGALINAFQSQVDDSITKAVAHALDAARISTSLPKVPGSDVTVRQASFAAGDGGRLLLRVSADGSLTAEGVAALLTPGPVQ